jgi:hypothetical protein
VEPVADALTIVLDAPETADGAAAIPPGLPDGAGAELVPQARTDAQLLAPVVAVAQQLEALAAQRVEGVRDANPSRTVGTGGS